MPLCASHERNGERIAKRWDLAALGDIYDVNAREGGEISSSGYHTVQNDYPEMGILKGDVLSLWR